MRIKTTRKQIEQNFKCIAVGYCQVQYLLNYASAPYYSSGVYGWNFDTYPFVYKGCNVAICTGYRHVPGKRVPYDIEKSFDDRAKDILADSEGNKRERLDVLIQEFLAVAFPEL